MLIVPVSPTGSNDPWSVAARFSFVAEYRKTVKTVTLEKIPGRWSQGSALDINYRSFAKRRAYEVIDKKITKDPLVSLVLLSPLSTHVNELHSRLEPLNSEQLRIVL